MGYADILASLERRASTLDPASGAYQEVVRDYHRALRDAWASPSVSGIDVSIMDRRRSHRPGVDTRGHPTLPLAPNVLSTVDARYEASALMDRADIGYGAIAKRHSALTILRGACGRFAYHHPYSDGEVDRAIDRFIEAIHLLRAAGL